MQVLQAVAGALTHRSCKSHSHSELLSLIVSEPPCRQMYVLLHNIDGPGVSLKQLDCMGAAAEAAQLQQAHQHIVCLCGCSCDGTTAAQAALSMLASLLLPRLLLVAASLCVVSSHVGCQWCLCTQGFRLLQVQLI